MKTDKENIRKISVTGKTRTYYVTLPKDVVRRLKWQKGQKVVVEYLRAGVRIKDWKP